MDHIEIIVQKIGFEIEYFSKKKNFSLESCICYQLWKSQGPLIYLQNLLLADYSHKSYSEILQFISKLFLVTIKVFEITNEINDISYSWGDIFYPSEDNTNIGKTIYLCLAYCPNYVFSIAPTGIENISLRNQWLMKDRIPQINDLIFICWYDQNPVVWKLCRILEMPKTSFYFLEVCEEFDY